MLGVDEKSSIQALDHIQSGPAAETLPLRAMARYESAMVTTARFVALDVVIGRYMR
jgi:hypothetical protein